MSKAAIENNTNEINWPKKSSRIIEAKIKLRLTPNKIISNANKTNKRLGLIIKIKRAKKIKIKDKNNI